MSDATQVVSDEWEAQAEHLRTLDWINGELIDHQGTLLNILEADVSEHSLLLAYGGPTAVLTPDPLGRRSTFLLTVSYGNAEHSEPITLSKIDGYIIEQMGLGVQQ